MQAYGPLRASLAGTPDAAAMTRLAASRPKPFLDRTQLGYTLADPGSVELTIYDVRGGAVRTLDQGLRPTGQHLAPGTAGTMKGRRRRAAPTLPTW